MTILTDKRLAALRMMAEAWADSDVDGTRFGGIQGAELLALLHIYAALRRIATDFQPGPCPIWSGVGTPPEEFARGEAVGRWQALTEVQAAILGELADGGEGRG